MQIIYSCRLLKEHLKTLEGRTIGFVPTMGALHEGHISLAERSLRENDITVVSIFVNPTQFNDPEDLRKYPRDPVGDHGLLSAFLGGGDIVFSPDAEDLYSHELPLEINLGDLENVMEGRFRPGHFMGVVRVVKLLFEWVEPGTAYFGQKDFQQLTIIREMVRQLNLPVKIASCPIVREKNGLAMSSRNRRLDQETRNSAGIIFRTLSKYSEIKDVAEVDRIREMVINEINSTGTFRTEYFDIVDNLELKSVTPATNIDPARKYYGCIALYAGEVRLIDNVRFSFPVSKG